MANSAARRERLRLERLRRERLRRERLRRGRRRDRLRRDRLRRRERLRRLDQRAPRSAAACYGHSISCHTISHHNVTPWYYMSLCHFQSLFILNLQKLMIDIDWETLRTTWLGASETAGSDVETVEETVVETGIVSESDPWCTSRTFSVWHQRCPGNFRSPGNSHVILMMRSVLPLIAWCGRGSLPAISSNWGWDLAIFVIPLVVLHATASQQTMGQRWADRSNAMTALHPLQPVPVSLPWTSAMTTSGSMQTHWIYH